MSAKSVPFDELYFEECQCGDIIEWEFDTLDAQFTAECANCGRSHLLIPLTASKHSVTPDDEDDGVDGGEDD